MFLCIYEESLNHSFKLILIKPSLFFFLDNMLHSDGHHNMEEKICCYLHYITTFTISSSRKTDRIYYWNLLVHIKTHFKIQMSLPSYHPQLTSNSCNKMMILLGCVLKLGYWLLIQIRAQLTVSTRNMSAKEIGVLIYYFLLNVLKTWQIN